LILRENATILNGIYFADNDLTSQLGFILFVHTLFLHMSELLMLSIDSTLKVVFVFRR
jgi:hypothetical protein